MEAVHLMDFIHEKELLLSPTSPPSHPIVFYVVLIYWQSCPTPPIQGIISLSNMSIPGITTLLQQLLLIYCAALTVIWKLAVFGNISYFEIFIQLQNPILQLAGSHLLIFSESFYHNLTVPQRF